MCDCWPLFREGLKDVTWGWGLLQVLTFTAWILGFLVERSCDFVEIQTTDGTSSFGRGLTQGRLEPDDQCQGWGKYSGLQLDNDAALAFAAANLSIALGAFVWGYLLICVCCQPFPRFFKWIVVAVCILLAGFQAMTHTMTKSSLCQGTRIVVMENGNEIVYDTCTKDTLAYNLTFATIALWAVAAVLFSVVRLHKVKADNEDDNNNAEEA